jgi:SAM-dependent methyltransferase
MASTVKSYDSVFSTLTSIHAVLYGFYSCQRVCEVLSVMKDVPNNWIEWWNTENIVTPATWLNNMDVFVTASDALLGYNLQDIVLDIGSGPGYFADFLKDRVKEIHCLDTSQRYLAMCKNNFKGYNNLYFYKIPENNYTDLSFLHGKRFSAIICQSVIQYYRNINEVESLVTEVQKIASPGARFLISDIPIDSSLAARLYSLLKGALRKKRLLEISTMLFRLAVTAKYRAPYISPGLLTFSDEKLKQLIGKLNLDAEVLSNKLTINENRRHLLIRF